MQEVQLANHLVVKQAMHISHWGVWFVLMVTFALSHSSHCFSYTENMSQRDACIWSDQSDCREPHMPRPSLIAYGAILRDDKTTHYTNTLQRWAIYRSLNQETLKKEQSVFIHPLSAKDIKFYLWMNSVFVQFTIIIVTCHSSYRCSGNVTTIQWNILKGTDWLSAQGKIRGWLAAHMSI